MRTASVRQLKNQTSELLRRAAHEDVVITSRGKPVAFLVGIRPRDITIRLSVIERQKRELSRLLDDLWKMKPEKGRKWISQDYDKVLYDEEQG